MALSARSDIGRIIQRPAASAERSRLPAGPRIVCGMRHLFRRPDARPLARLLWPAALLALLAPGCSGGPQQNTAVTRVQGRDVAPRTTMDAADDFVRIGRAEAERRDLLFNGLNIVPGMTACEVGAGNGFYTLELARLVYPGGKVIAVDILPAMLEALAVREDTARRRGDQMVPIQRVGGQPDDPALPEGGCDVVLVAHAYHEFDRPDAMMAGLKRALAPDGRLVLVEYRAEQPPPKTPKVRTMQKAQLHREIGKHGFRLIGQIDSLPWQHVLLYGGAQSPRQAVSLRPWRPKFSTVEDDGIQPPPETPPEEWDGEGR